ncbi:MAG: metallophosphoesterase [Megasphaera sp.]|jgi:hypothetical protein|nr:metallophosphoesterase [Megasphaera sp.]MCI1248281.1 metallophosphoesterase [Megasphaera sp.]
MIYITGDIHSGLDRFQHLHDMGLSIGSDDYIIICGDFGLLWEPQPSPQEIEKIRWLSAQPYTTLFIDGNHENFGRLRHLPIKKWHGGYVQPLQPNVLHLLRGEIYSIENHTFFTFGGATSTDKDLRIPGISWWPDENPTPEEFEHGKKQLCQAGWNVDYVITHTAPQHWKTNKLGHLEWDTCRTSDMLDEIESHLTYKNWFFGHMHRDDHGPDRKDQWLYEDIVYLDGTTAGRLPLDWIESRLPPVLQAAIQRYHRTPITMTGNTANRARLRRIIIECRRSGEINDETAGRLVEEYCY